MTEASLDGREIHDRKQFHDKVAMELGFPSWYGSNLDALYDCLMDIHEDTALVIRQGEKLRENLGTYGEKVFRVLRQAEQENRKLCIRITQE